MIANERKKADLRLSRFFSVPMRTESALICQHLKLPEVQRADFGLFLRTPFLGERDENYQRVLALEQRQMEAEKEELAARANARRRQDPFYAFPAEPNGKELAEFLYTKAECAHFLKFKFNSGDYVRYLKNLFHRLKKEQITGKMTSDRQQMKKEKRIYLI